MGAQNRPKSVPERSKDALWTLGGACNAILLLPGRFPTNNIANMDSKRNPHRIQISITSQSAFSVYIDMFSDKCASLCHLSALRKKLQIPCKGHQIRGGRFFSSSSRLRAKLGEKQTKHQPTTREKSTPKPSQKVLISIPPPRTPPKSLQNSKKPLPGVPGVSPEGPRSDPGCLRRELFKLPRAPHELQNRPGGVQSASGVSPRALWAPFWLYFDLKMEVWELIWLQKRAQIPTPRPPPHFQHRAVHRGGPCERREIEQRSAGIAKRSQFADSNASVTMTRWRTDGYPHTHNHTTTCAHTYTHKRTQTHARGHRHAHTLTQPHTQHTRTHFNTRGGRYTRLASRVVSLFPLSSA